MADSRQAKSQWERLVCSCIIAENFKYCYYMLSTIANIACFLANCKYSPDTDCGLTRKAMDI